MKENVTPLFPAHTKNSVQQKKGDLSVPVALYTTRTLLYYTRYQILSIHFQTIRDMSHGFKNKKIRESTIRTPRRIPKYTKADRKE